METERADRHAGHSASLPGQLSAATGLPPCERHRRACLLSVRLGFASLKDDRQSLAWSHLRVLSF